MAEPAISFHDKLKGYGTANAVGADVDDQSMQDPAAPKKVALPPRKYCGCTAEFWKKVRVFALAILLILSQTMQVVSFKKAGYSFGPYPYMILVFVAAVFVPIFSIAAAVISFCGGGFVPEITTWRFKLHYCVIGVFNALNGILIIFSNPHVAGILQSILAQAVIPFTLLLSIVWLRTKFAWFQYLGAAIVVGGVIVSLVPSFESDDSRNNSSESGVVQHDGAFISTASPSEPSRPSQEVLWAIVFCMGQVPQSLYV